MSKTLGDNIEWELVEGGGVVVREMCGCIKSQGLIDYATVVSTLGSSHMIFLFYDLKNKIDVIYSDVTRN